MLIRLLFEGNKVTGYLAYMEEVYPYQEREGVTVIEIREEDLELITGEDWGYEYQKLILVDGKMEIDESWL